MTSVLAQTMKCPKLDVSMLQKAHEICGSGFMIPCTCMVLASFAASAEFLDDICFVPRSLSVSVNGFHVIPVPQNGRCFSTSLWLATRASDAQRCDWQSVLRSGTSMPISRRTGTVCQTRLKAEESCALIVTGSFPVDNPSSILWGVLWGHVTFLGVLFSFHLLYIYICACLPSSLSLRKNIYNGVPYRCI